MSSFPATRDGRQIPDFFTSDKGRPDMVIKALAKKFIRRLGYEVVKCYSPVPEFCAKLKLAMLQPLDLQQYRAACPPLFSQPTALSQTVELLRFRSIDEALHNVSMSEYFQVSRKDDHFMLTDDYPKSVYYSRQRMLYTAYQKYHGSLLDGLSVLDIGCSSGYYSFFCSKLGARSVLGIDARPEHADQFRLVHQTLGLSDSCRYQNLDMEFALQKLEESFDLVLAQGVMYHVYDHPRFIRNLHRLTKNLLILEGDCSGRSDYLCLPQLENVENLRMGIHGPVCVPSLQWTVELLRWAGFRDITYVFLPRDIPDDWGFFRLARAMLVARK